MAKEQKRSNRELKKPKKVVAAPAPPVSIATTLTRNVKKGGTKR